MTPDREAVERLIIKLDTCNDGPHLEDAVDRAIETLRALLARCEAAEAENKQLERKDYLCCEGCACKGYALIKECCRP